jgi:hypothetical protein
VSGQKVTLIVWTQRVLRFRLFVWLLSMAVNFMCTCSINLFYYCCKECMGRRPCLFVCYGE